MDTSKSATESQCTLPPPLSEPAPKTSLSHHLIISSSNHLISHPHQLITISHSPPSLVSLELRWPSLLELLENTVHHTCEHQEPIMTSTSLLHRMSVNTGTSCYVLLKKTNLGWQTTTLSTTVIYLTLKKPISTNNLLLCLAPAFRQQSSSKNQSCVGNQAARPLCPSLSPSLSVFKGSSCSQALN